MHAERTREPGLDQYTINHVVLAISDEKTEGRWTSQDVERGIREGYALGQSRASSERIDADEIDAAYRRGVMAERAIREKRERTVTEAEALARAVRKAFRDCPEGGDVVADMLAVVDAALPPTVNGEPPAESMSLYFDPDERAELFDPRSRP